jgi:hypothetical protein
MREWPLKDRRKVLEDAVDGSPILPARAAYRTTARRHGG